MNQTQLPFGDRFKNPMEDFKPVFAAIKAKLAIATLINRELRLNAKLKPGATLEARIAERDARLKPIHAARSTAGIYPKYIPVCRYETHSPVSLLLTAHRVLRGKAANHGIKATDAQAVTDFVVAEIRKELAVVAEGAKAIA